jgi:hypothetical protein
MTWTRFSARTHPQTPVGTAGWLPPIPGQAASTDEVYAAMDWLAGRQRKIEKQLAARHLREVGMAMSGLSSSWVEGSQCPPAAFGHSSDGKRGRKQIE